MEELQEGLEPLDHADDLVVLSGEVEAVGWGNRSMQQCRLTESGPRLNLGCCKPSRCLT